MPAPPQQDPKVQTFSLGDFQLQSGETIPDAHIAYRTYGDKKNPCIIYPTWYSGTITAGNEWLISTPDHPRKALDPSKYFIVVPALFGNGESTSPSNTKGEKGGINLPKATFFDNVRAQHQLVTREFNISKVYAVIGWSMGAGQTFTWAAAFPDMVQLAVPFCGSARTSDHNIAFLEAVAGGITTDSAGWKDGHYTEQPVRGLKALARVYSGWGFSQAFYREKGFKKHFGLDSHEQIMTDFWEKYFCTKDANNLLYHVHTWRHGDIGSLPEYALDSKRDVPKSAGGRFGARGNGERLNEEDEKAFHRALTGIKAKTLIMPCKTDLYFPPEDSEIEHEIMGKETSELKVIDSIWGHWAGGPGDSKVDAQWIDQQVEILFSQNPPAGKA